MEKFIVAVKWFAYGLATALLFAPRSGQETRQQLMQLAGGYVSQVLNTGSQMADRAAARTQALADQAAA